MSHFYVLGTWHPTRILHGGHALDLPARSHVRHLVDVAQALSVDEEPAWWDVEQPPVPGAVLEPTLKDLDAWAQPDLLRAGVAVDIECAGHVLRGIGFCRLHDLVPLWWPVRRQGGAQYWTVDELPHAVDWAYRLLADPQVPKLMHNGLSFDLPYLEEHGFKVEGYLDLGADTMLMQHLAYPEQPKALNYCASLYCRLPQWKRLAKVDEEADGK